MRKIRPPTALVMEAVFPLQVGSFDVVPEQQEARLQAGGRFRGTVAQAGHGLRAESTLAFKTSFDEDFLQRSNHDDSDLLTEMSSI
jgi:hypothetical protein